MKLYLIGILTGILFVVVFLLYFTEAIYFGNDLWLTSKDFRKELIK